MKVLVTGANGFIGTALCSYLKGKGWYVRAVVWQSAGELSGIDECVEVGDVHGATDWKNVLDAIRRRSEINPYISFDRFKNICNRHGVTNELSATYAAILNELGYLIYYREDETLKDIVILKPEYLSKAVSFVLEDKPTKEAYGLVEHTRLSGIWDNPDRSAHEWFVAPDDPDI